MEKFKSYNKISSYIPLVMNSLYTNAALNSVNLEEIRDAFRVKQIKSKSWLLDHVLLHVKKSKKICVIGSWLGYTSLCLYHLGYKNITECDSDPRLTYFSRHLNRFNKTFIHITADVNDIDLSLYDIVINTSCEHIKNNNWFNKLNSNQLIFLQSTDYVGDDHYNICNSIEDIKNKYKFKNQLYVGKLNLETYNRFMIYGYV